MLEQIETQGTFGNSLATTENAIRQLSHRQSVIDNFTTSRSAAVEQMLERYGRATQRPLIAEIVADSQRYDSVLRSFVHAGNTTIALDTVLARQSKASQLFEETNAALGQFATVTEQIARQLSEFKVGASAYASAISRASLIDNELERLRNTAGMTMLAELHKTPLSLSESVEVLKSTVQREIKNGQSSTISLAGWISIVSFVFNLWFAYHLSMQNAQQTADSEARVLQELDSIRVEVIERFDKLEDDDNTYYVVTTQLNVRAGPSTDHRVEAVVHPNQYLRLLDTDGRWLHVEYFDFLDEATRRGWVYKRFLKEIIISD